jgi:hypothetical protein
MIIFSCRLLLAKVSSPKNLIQGNFYLYCYFKSLTWFAVEIGGKYYQNVVLWQYFVSTCLVCDKGLREVTIKTNQSALTPIYCQDAIVSQQ